ncbi:ester cyclase [Haloprofundus halophilus]|uniref:ester cyclase n=1 Tax=Haloprofundus halophilus TaxID=2283527 RepID=UPI000E44B349|nr:ester cyclase [Haloprofundus halophilus]
MATTEPQTQMERQFRRVADEAWSKGDYGVLDEALADDYVSTHYQLERSFRGVDEYRTLIETYREAMPDLTVHVDDLIVADDCVVCRYRVTGTHEGTLRVRGMDVPPTGKSVETPGITIVRFDGDRCAEEFNSPHALGMMEQLGVIPGGADEMGEASA